MILRSARVVFSDAVRPASIHIEDGRIARVGPHDDTGSGRRSAKASAEGREELVDVGALVISPGIVDTHVHVNEPGRTDWEGFDTATRAAAAGGVTMVVDMPLNSVPATTTVASLEAKRAAAARRCHVDVAFWGGVVPGNAGEIDALVEAGVRGFKCFLVPSGVDEFPAVSETDLREAMPILARRNVPLLVHAESPRHIADLGLRNADFSLQSNPQSNPQSAIRIPQYARYLATRPPAAEVEAIRMMVRLSLEFGLHVHIVHVASAEAAAEITRAKADGARITAETCPHYLTFAAEEIPDGATEYKCAPPIRQASQREALWNALQAGVLDLVATDHSPAPPAMKCPGDFMRAWGGIASLELGLAAVWTAGASREFSTLESQFSERLSAASSEPKVDPCALARWMSAAPAALAGFANRKGRIAAGCDADLIVWDPDAQWTVEPARLHQRHKLTPYAGRRLRGVVHATYLRGERVWDAGRLAHGATGRLL